MSEQFMTTVHIAMERWLPAAAMKHVCSLNTGPYAMVFCLSLSTGSPAIALQFTQ